MRGSIIKTLWVRCFVVVLDWLTDVTEMSWNHLRVIDWPKVQEVDASFTVAAGDFGNCYCLISLLVTTWLVKVAVAVV